MQFALGQCLAGPRIVRPSAAERDCKCLQPAAPPSGLLDAIDALSVADARTRPPQVGPKFAPVKSKDGPLDYEEVKAKLDDGERSTAPACLPAAPLAACACAACVVVA